MKTWIIVGIIMFVILLFLLVFRFGGEDSWIKDDRGIWIKHGVPSDTPDYVLEQQETISLAMELFEDTKLSDIQLSSQCLGTVGDYVVDIVHVPRTDEDNLPENQCEDYISGKAGHFIELDKVGNIVRIR